MVPLAAMTVAEFASAAFVQQAVANPMSPQAVLSFFFGCNFFTNDYQIPMREGAPLKTMMEIWYKQSDEYDRLCQAFRPVIQAAGKKELSDWNTSIDGKMSQILLCDQIARNAFRGNSEAFAYESVAEDLSSGLIRQLMNKQKDGETSVPGEFYPPYVNFLVLPMMHSESIAHQELGLDVCDWAQEHFDASLRDAFVLLRDFSLNHKEVIDRFGRFPHRNKKLGRESTPEEQAWLDDTDALPVWAKSQG